LYSDKIQTIARSRNTENFDETAETALEEESAILSKQERHRGQGETPVKCGNCGKLGHPTQSCFLKKTPKAGQARVSQARVGVTAPSKSSPPPISFSVANKKKVKVSKAIPVTGHEGL
jgi:hypothetical protein